MKRLLSAVVVVLWALAVFPAQPSAWAQTDGQLVIERAGSTLVVGTREVPAGTIVRFRVTVDGVKLSSVHTVASGQSTELDLPSLVAGSHSVELTVIDPVSVRGAAGSFRTRGTFNSLALILAAALVALLIYYRRRVMEPFTRRYARRPPDEPPEDRPSS